MLLAEGLAYHKDDGEYYVEREEEAVLTLIEKPDLWICDFCSATPVEWRYEASDHILGSEKNPRKDTDWDTHVSVGEWLACASCAEMIEKQNWIGLLRHGVDSYVEKNCKNIELNDDAMLMLTTMIGGIQEGFIVHRTGTRERI